MNEKVYAFIGKVSTDEKRDKPSFIVDKIDLPEKIEERAVTEVHIQVADNVANDKMLFDLKEFFFGSSGPCSLFIHVNSEGKSYMIKASEKITAQAGKEYLERLRDNPLVKNVWTV